MTDLNKPISIRIFLRDGIPDGIRTAEIGNATIHAAAFKGAQLGVVKDEFTLARPGVYILTGWDDVNEKFVAYVGESENLHKRLKTYASSGEKEWWIDTYVFASKDEYLTKAHVRYVEAELIKAAKKSHKWSLPNVQNPPSCGKLPRPDTFLMDEFIDQIKILSGTLGCTVFMNAEEVLKKSESDDGDNIWDESPTFHLQGDGYQATGIFSIQSGSFIVKAGSIVKPELAPSLPNGIKKLRSELESNGVLAHKENSIRFLSDYPFTSASSAANVVTGSPTNGRASWKTAGKVTFGEYLEKLGTLDISK